jgi:signal transduction histidine kinase
MQRHDQSVTKPGGRNSARVPDGSGVYEENLLDALPARVCVLDTNGVVRAANSAWRDFEEHTPIFGTRCPAGENFLALCEATSGEGKALANGIHRVLSGASYSYSFDYTAVENGDKRWYRIVASPAPTDHGGVMVAHFDITERWRADAGLRRSDEQLLQTQKMEAIGRLAGGLAHDFNNLLTLISGYTEILLARMPAGNPDRVEIEEIRKAANRGAGLTTQLLSFSRRQQVEPVVLDLNQLVSDMERMLRRMIGEDVQLSAELSPGLGKIKADPGQIGQVIMNLVLNSRDAMPRGGRIVIYTANAEIGGRSMRMPATLDPGPYVMLAIEDNGVGMDAETLAHLFEPFFTKGKEKGTGLGLSTVYGIVKQSRGEVWAESRVGKGSRLTVYLPRVADGVEPAPPAERTPALLVGNETILLVEDEVGVRRLLKHVLVKQGYNVLEAISGEEALEICERHGARPHLLLTDMVMPRMNGRDLATALTARQPGLKVLYVSGYTDDVLLRSGALGPGMAFLQKPLRPQVLIAKVREILDGPAVAAGSAATGASTDG